MVMVLILPLALVALSAAARQPPAVEVDAALPVAEASTEASVAVDLARRPARSLFASARVGDGRGLWSLDDDEETTTTSARATTSTVPLKRVTTTTTVVPATTPRNQELPPASTAPPLPRPTTTTTSRPTSQPGGPATPQELAVLACIRQRESGGNYSAVSANGLYHGAYQFLQSTWNGAAQLAGRPDLVGVPPEKAAPADQDAVALALYRASGLGPWGGHCP